MKQLLLVVLLVSVSVVHAIERKGEYYQLRDMKGVIRIFPAGNDGVWVITNKSYATDLIWFCEELRTTYQFTTDFDNTVCRLSNFYTMELVDGCHKVVGMDAPVDIYIEEVVTNTIKDRDFRSHDGTDLWFTANVGGGADRALFRCESRGRKNPICEMATKTPYKMGGLGKGGCCLNNTDAVRCDFGLKKYPD